MSTRDASTPKVFSAGLVTGLLFLSDVEIEALTGYRLPKYQRRWLAENGYSFDVRRDGRPVVSRAHYEARHEPKNQVRPSAFDLDALDSVK